MSLSTFLKCKVALKFLTECFYPIAVVRLDYGSQENKCLVMNFIILKKSCKSIMQISSKYQWILILMY